MRVSIRCWPGRMVDYLWMRVSVWCSPGMLVDESECLVLAGQDG